MKKQLIFIFLFLIIFSSALIFCSQASKYDLSNTKIVYVVHEQHNSFIYVMDHDGSNKKKLAEGAMPCWSPDAEQIAFAAENDGNWDIYYMNANGSTITRLTSSPAGDTNPAWSPDSTKIVYDLSKGEGSEIYVINKDGSYPVCLGEGSNPAWSPFVN